MTIREHVSGDVAPGADVDRSGVSETERLRLEKLLRSAIRGDIEFDWQTRAVYASDSSNYRQIPLGVVFLRDHDDVLSAIAVCREVNAPVLGRGGGTSLAGQALASRAFRRSRSARELKPGRSIDESRIVALWPDTFSNAYDPEALHQATDILQAFGFHVVIPSERACCDRRLYDSGRLNQPHNARLLRVLGVDIDVLESGCCGLAGSFAYKPSNVEIAETIAQEQWRPQIEMAMRIRRVVMDGFSFRRQALHTMPNMTGDTSLIRLLWERTRKDSDAL